jgi:8-oxo-dGTP pyrophosphatase MutT (NUDIX family)
MNELAENLTRIEKIEDSPGNARNIRPRDAATLILLDRSRSEPHVLVGRRHDRHAFMAGKFVFPGGRIERSDGRMESLGSLDKASERRLLFGLPARAQNKARTLALTALRETFEETGLMIGRRHKAAAAMRTCPPDWKPSRKQASCPIFRVSPLSPAPSRRPAAPGASIRDFSSPTAKTSPRKCPIPPAPMPSSSN